MSPNFAPGGGRWKRPCIPLLFSCRGGGSSRYFPLLTHADKARALATLASLESRPKEMISQLPNNSLQGPFLTHWWPQQGPSRSLTCSSQLGEELPTDTGPEFSFHSHTSSTRSKEVLSIPIGNTSRNQARPQMACRGQLFKSSENQNGPGPWPVCSAETQLVPAKIEAFSRVQSLLT